jgi:formylglycine-generating enzyme required for sulfatase activity
MPTFNPSLFRWPFLCLLFCWAGCGPTPPVSAQTSTAAVSPSAVEVAVTPPTAPTASAPTLAAPAQQSEGSAAGGCPEGYVRIAPGTFIMGSPEVEEGRDDNETEHSVTITRAYCMKATEVTQGEWQSVMGNNPSEFKNCGANCPVEQVSWDDAVGYANALSRREGLPQCYSGSTFTGLGCMGYRLPMESEWEYAARAGTKEATYGGDLTIRGERDEPVLGRIAWYGGNSGVSYDGAFDCSDWVEKQFPSENCGTHPVRQKEPNAWGLYDMLGNVWEWTGDWYGESPGAASDPAGAAARTARVFRGGSWGSFARLARAAISGYAPPVARFAAVGFRLVRTAPVGEGERGRP